MSCSASDMILIVCGMKREARALGGKDGSRDATVIVAGTDHDRFEAELEAGVAAGARAIVSMGLAGALAPRLKVGDWVIGTISPTAMERREWSVGASRPREVRPRPEPAAKRDASAAWIGRIATLLPGAVVGRIHADGTLIVTAAHKETLHFSTRALACDMESHVAARVAQRHGLPFAVARVISDEADRAMPRAAQVAMAPNGGIRLGAVLLALVTRPWQIPALTGVGMDAGRATKRLARGYDMLSRAGFVLGDEGKLALDMA